MYEEVAQEGAVESHFVTHEGNERACSIARVARQAAPDAEYWVARVTPARNYGLTAKRINTALKTIREHEDEIRTAWRPRWRKHFDR